MFAYQIHLTVTAQIQKSLIRLTDHLARSHVDTSAVACLKAAKALFLTLAWFRKFETLELVIDQGIASTDVDRQAR